MYGIAQKIEKNGHYCPNAKSGFLIKFTYQAGRYLQCMKGESKNET